MASPVPQRACEFAWDACATQQAARLEFQASATSSPIDGGGGSGGSFEAFEAGSPWWTRDDKIEELRALLELTPTRHARHDGEHADEERR